MSTEARSDAEVVQDSAGLQPAHIPLRAFEQSLMDTWVYKKSQNQEEDKSFDTWTYRTGEASILSQITLAQISILSVVALPICMADLSNSIPYQSNHNDHDHSHEQSIREEDTSLEQSSGSPSPASSEAHDADMPGPNREHFSSIYNLTQSWATDLSHAIFRDKDYTVHLLVALDEWGRPLTSHSEGWYTLVVHLHLDDDDKVHTFCVYQRDQPLSESYSIEGRSTKLTRQKDCKTIRAKARVRTNHVNYANLHRLIYLTAQYLLRQDQSGRNSLDHWYSEIPLLISKVVTRCVMCGKDVGTNVHRPTICTSPQCMEDSINSGIDLCISDIRGQPAAVTLLLTAADATVRSVKLSRPNPLDFLPSPPKALDNAAELRRLFDRLPRMDKLREDAPYPSSRPDTDIQRLLAWTCLGYRGFLVSASGGAWEIKNLPRVSQFLLVDASPESEEQFAKYHSQARHALFRATTMDVLYTVLTYGLTALRDPFIQATQTQHAHRSDSVRLFQDPAQALANCYGVFEARGGSNFADMIAKMKGAKLLLGCEAAGSFDDFPAVATDPSRVMVRYIFIVPPDVKVSKAKVVRAVLYNFAWLQRSRTRGETIV